MIELICYVNPYSDPSSQIEFKDHLLKKAGHLTILKGLNPDFYADGGAKEYYEYLKDPKYDIFPDKQTMFFWEI